jgi:hypothetical protein
MDANNDMPLEDRSVVDDTRKLTNYDNLCDAFDNEGLGKIAKQLAIYALKPGTIYDIAENELRREGPSGDASSPIMKAVVYAGATKVELIRIFGYCLIAFDISSAIIKYF